jgi:hypothetical protein
MLRATLLCLVVLGLSAAQDPFVPLDFNAPGGVQDQAGARRDWVKLTNQRMEMAGKDLRVDVADNDLTAVILVKGATRSQAKRILAGKGEHQILLRSILGLGFTRIVVRDSQDNAKAWGARLERGRAILDD